MLRYYRSQSFTFNLNDSINVPLDFLANAYDHQRFPEIVALEFRFEGLSIDGSTTNLTGEDHWRLLKNVALSDGGGLIINGSGMNTLRPWSMAALGHDHVDPDAVTTAATGLDVSLVVPFEAPNLLKGEKDFRIPVGQLLDKAGSPNLLVSTVTAADAGITDVVITGGTGTIRVIAWVRDRRRPVIPPRLYINETRITGQEQEFAVGGRLVHCVGIGYDANAAGYNAWTSNTKHDVDQLQLSQVERELLAARWEQEHDNFSGDEIEAGNAYPIMATGRHTSLEECPEVGRMNVRWNESIPDDAYLFIARVTPRHAQTAAAGARLGSAAALNAVAESRGRVSAAGMPKPSASGGKSRFLPIKL